MYQESIEMTRKHGIGKVRASCRKSKKITHAPIRKEEAPKEEKIQPLCWPKGPLLESIKETALSSPGNDALSAAIRASRRGCGNGRGVSGERRREREAVVMAVAEVVRGRERWETELSYINRRERCVGIRRCGNLRVLWVPPQPADAHSFPLALHGFFLYGSLRSSYGGLFVLPAL